MSKSDFTFLTKEQVEGPNKLEIFKKIGIDAPVTDFTKIVGINQLQDDKRTILDKNRI